MCGIGGFFTPKSARVWNAEMVMPEFLFVNQLRGRDAVGLFGALQKDPTWVQTIKMAGSADAFLDWKVPHERFLKKAEDFKFMVAHNRAATIGAKDDVKAAHPHEVGKIILVHNGTLTNFPKGNFISDSHWFTHELNEHEGNFIDAEKQVYGPYAFVWHDGYDNTLNFARNGGRPLHFVKCFDDSTWFASEPAMLELILPRKHKTIDKRWALAENVWIKVDMEGNTVEREIPRGMQEGKIIRELTYEQWNNEPEQKRAAVTVHYGRREAKLWDHLEDEHFYEGRGPRPLPMPVAQPTSASSQAAGDGKPRVIKFEAWNGMAAKDSVYFYPKVFREGTGGKGVIIEGAFMVWDGKIGVEFQKGVRVIARVETDNPPAHMNYLMGFDCVWEAEITAIVENLTFERVLIYARLAEPHDMITTETASFTVDEVQDAWDATYNKGVASASEVAEYQEKKCEWCDAGESQGMCFVGEVERQDPICARYCLFERKGQGRAVVEHPTCEAGGALEGDPSVDPAVCSVGTSPAKATNVYRASDKENFVRVARTPYSVRCECCSTITDVFSEAGVFIYNVAYHTPRQPTQKGGKAVESERMNVCGNCEQGFVQLFQNGATLTLLAKHGYKFHPNVVPC
jgi:hypothetical protein